MKREKKIGLNYYPYKTKNRYYNEDNQEVFPLYVNVNYSGKSTKFPLLEHELTDVGEFKKVMFTEDEFQNGIDKSEFCINLEEIIRDIIRYEDKCIGENYKITGLKTRFNNYITSLATCIEERVLKVFTHFVGNHYTHNEYLQIESQLNSDECEDTYPSVLYSFFTRYYYFHNDKINFKERMSEDLISSISTFMYLVLVDKDYMEQISGRLLLHDWMVTPEARDVLEHYIKNNSTTSILKNVKDMDELFQKVFNDFQPEILNLKFDDIVENINGLLVTSFRWQEINVSFERMIRD